jgi:hypothetical protein
VQARLTKSFRPPLHHFCTSAGENDSGTCCSSLSLGTFSGEPAQRREELTALIRQLQDVAFSPRPGITSLTKPVFKERDV